MRAKMLSFLLMSVLTMFLILSIASPVLAEEGGEAHEEEHETPGSENGLIVAVGGAIGVYGLIFFLVFRILSKRKKAQVKQ